jgi:hypothetical protein
MEAGFSADAPWPPSVVGGDISALCDAGRSVSSFFISGSDTASGRLSSPATAEGLLLSVAAGPVFTDAVCLPGAFKTYSVKRISIITVVMPIIVRHKREPGKAFSRELSSAYLYVDKESSFKAEESGAGLHKSLSVSVEGVSVAVSVIV